MIRTLKEYVWYRKAIFLFYAIVTVFFPLVHFLADAPMTSMGYSILIVTFILLVWMTVDFLLFRSNLHRLSDIEANISAYNHIFPYRRNAVEGAYQDIIGQLYTQLQNERYVAENRHTEQTDYYTMWVHQVKTPISAMRLVLQSEEHDPVIGQELFKIEQYAEMALQYVKIGNLASDLMIREYNLTDIVRDSVKKYAALFIYRKLPVDLDVFDIKVTTDSKWLSFIIEQLLSNSVKYTQRGGIRIFAENGALVIRDTGIGIRPEDMERIFEKGYTGYNGRMDKKASGIGLYMAKKVADALSVGIRITSEVGVGTTAYLSFPGRIGSAAV